MLFEDFSRTLQKNLEHAALLMVNAGDEQPLADLISKIQSEAFRDGYNNAVQTLKNNVGGINYECNI